MGNQVEKENLLPRFRGCESYLQKRNMLIGIHELKYSKEVDENIRPFIEEELEGVYRGLKNNKHKGVYCKKPDPVNYKRIYDEVCQYKNGNL